VSFPRFVALELENARHVTGRDGRVMTGADDDRLRVESVVRGVDRRQGAPTIDTTEDHDLAVAGAEGIEDHRVVRVDEADHVGPAHAAEGGDGRRR